MEFVCTEVSKSNKLIGHKEISWPIICQIKQWPDDWHASQRENKKKLFQKIKTQSQVDSILSLLHVGTKTPQKQESGRKEHSVISRPRRSHTILRKRFYSIIRKKNYKKRNLHHSKGDRITDLQIMLMFNRIILMFHKTNLTSIPVQKWQKTETGETPHQDTPLFNRHINVPFWLKSENESQCDIQDR